MANVTANKQAYVNWRPRWCQWSHWVRNRMWVVQQWSASQSLSDGVINGAVKYAFIMSVKSCLAIHTIDQLTCPLPHPVSAYLASQLWSLTLDGSVTAHIMWMVLPFAAGLAASRHQRIWLRHTLFASFYDGRLPRSEPKPKKAEFSVFR